MTVATLGISDLAEGTTFSFDQDVREADIDAFAAVTGDVSPLHMDAEFARSRGFRDRVAHGVLLSGYVSRLFGVHLPGRDCLLQSMNIKWLAPCCANDVITVTAVLSQVSEAARAVVADVTVFKKGTDNLLARGKVQFGFTLENR